MIDYATLVMCSKLAPTWGFVNRRETEEGLLRAHASQHNVDHQTEWNLGMGGVWEEVRCGAKITLFALMRRTGANRN